MGCEFVEPVDRVVVLGAGSVELTADGAAPLAAGIVVLLVGGPITPVGGGGKTVVLGGVMPDVGIAPVVTAIHGAAIGWLAETIGICWVGVWPRALTATAEHAAIMITRSTAAVRFISCSPVH